MIYKWYACVDGTDAMFEAQFSPRQSLRGLQRGTLWFSIVPGLVMSAVPMIRLTKSVVGLLVGFDRYVVPVGLSSFRDVIN